MPRERGCAAPTLIMCAAMALAFAIAPWLIALSDDPLALFPWLRWVAQPIVCAIIPAMATARGLNAFACAAIWCIIMIVPIFLYQIIPPLGSVALTVALALVSTSVGTQLYIVSHPRKKGGRRI